MYFTVPGITIANKLIHCCSDCCDTVLRKPWRATCTIANRLCDCCGTVLCSLKRPSFTNRHALYNLKKPSFSLCDCFVDNCNSTAPCTIADRLCDRCGTVLCKDLEAQLHHLLSRHCAS